MPIRTPLLRGALVSVVGVSLCVACATSPEPKDPKPAPAAANDPLVTEPSEALHRWVPGRAEAFITFPAQLGGAVFDPGTGVVYAMGSDGTPVARSKRGGQEDPTVNVVALDLDTGARRWQSAAAAVPLAIEAGKLIALQAVRQAAPLVLLDLGTGRQVGRCDEAQFSIGGWMSSSSNLRGVVHEGRTYLVNNHRTWYAGGVALSQRELAASRTESTGIVRVSVEAERCSVTPAKGVPLDTERAAAASGEALVLRGRGGADRAIYTVSSASAGAALFEVTAPANARHQVSADGRHLLLQAPRAGSSPMVYEVTVHEVPSGAGVATWELPFAVARFVVHGDHVLAATGAAVSGLELKSGRTVWTHGMPYLGYLGPYPP